MCMNYSFLLSIRNLRLLVFLYNVLYFLYYINNLLFTLITTLPLYLFLKSSKSMIIILLV